MTPLTSLLLKLTGLIIALAFAFAIGAGLIPLILTAGLVYRTLAGNY